MAVFWLVFLIIPFIEIGVFIAVGDELGVLQTLLLCLLTALIGGWLVRAQGLEALIKGQDSLRRGVMPVDEIFTGFCLLAAGAMLITPGFVTDAIGFTLLVPAARQYLRHWLGDRFTVEPGRGAQNRPPQDDNVIEGDYTHVDEPSRPPDDRLH